MTDFESTRVSDGQIATSWDVKHIERLLAVSRKVFEACAHENGALVAAPSHESYYPMHAKDYEFVWPRDAMFILRAARRTGLELAPSFFTWLRKAESWKETGLFHKKYMIDGTMARRRWQPDQTAAVLTMIRDYGGQGTLPAPARDLLVRTADALVGHWNGLCLDEPVQELWEQRIAFPDLEQNFAYTLASMVRGLLDADEVESTPRWRQTALQMQDVLDRSWPETFGRMAGRLRDDRIDASLLGLAYPFHVVAFDDTRFVRTVDTIIERLWIGGGLHRFENDEYDGWLAPDGTPRNLGAGHWPLLGFWLAITLHEMGRTAEARTIYAAMVDTADANGFFPEQVFANSLAQGVRPLAWSHAMFVLATDVIDVGP
jgi:GH15 family glucan-1,4-alpha-glucosidase